jgi:hypothetical protein
MVSDQLRSDRGAFLRLLKHLQRRIDGVTKGVVVLVEVWALPKDMLGLPGLEELSRIDLGLPQ